METPDEDEVQVIEVHVIEAMLQRWEAEALPGAKAYVNDMRWAMSRAGVAK